MSPAFDSLQVSDSVTVAAELQDSAGIRIERPVPLWASDNPAVVEVQGEGSRVRLLARSAGVATITASAAGIRQTLRIVVHAAGGSGFSLIAARRELQMGDSVSLEVRGTSGDATLEFRSLNPGVVSVSPTGMVVARGPGKAGVEAASGSARDTIFLTVKTSGRGSLTLAPGTLDLEVGDSALLTAQGDGSGALTWKVSDPSRLRISPRASNSVVVHAQAPGATEITAQAAGIRPATVSVGIMPARTLMLTESNVPFEMPANGTPPDARTVGVLHTGKGSVTTSVPDYTGPGGWLAHEIQRDQLVLRLTGDAARLGAGRYSARLILTDGRNRQGLTVTLTVTEKKLVPPEPQPLAATRTQLQEVIDGYVKAINAGDTVAIRQTYPTISAKGLREVMESRKAGKYDLMLRTEPKPGSAPGTLETVVTALYEGGKKAGAVPLIYSFAQQDGRWVIVGWKVSR